MRTFFIYPNLRKQSAREILPSVCERLRGRDIHLILPNQMRGTMHALHDEVMALDYMDTAEAVRIAAAAQNELPLLGINVGHVGFMTELEPAELDKMQALLEGDYQLDSRMMLHVEVERHGRRVYENDALNDIVIAKGTAFRVVRVGISADGEEVTRFNGDGVIAATPTGSTAYGLSAGGPVIEPSAENLAVIPICAHALAAKSFVFAPERTLAITAACEGGSEVFISADGGQGFAVRPDDRVLITRSALRTRLIRLKGNSFYRILQQKL